MCKPLTWFILFIFYLAETAPPLSMGFVWYCHSSWMGLSCNNNTTGQEKLFSFWGKKSRLFFFLTTELSRYFTPVTINGTPSMYPEWNIKGVFPWYDITFWTLGSKPWEPANQRLTKVAWHLTCTSVLSSTHCAWNCRTTPFKWNELCSHYSQDYNER